jgi:hypothetical protein
MTGAGSAAGEIPDAARGEQRLEELVLVDTGNPVPRGKLARQGRLATAGHSGDDNVWHAYLTA